MKPPSKNQQPKQQPLYPDCNFCHYRLRTARQKRRLVIKDRDKQLLARYRESNALTKQQREQPLEPLIPPIQRGWKRFFVLRDDVARSRQAAFYEGILARINTTERHHDRHFKQRKRKRGRKVYVVREQHLKRLDVWEWHQAAFTPKEAALFEAHEETDQGGRKKRIVYVFTEPWRFVLRVSPHLITHTRVLNLELERRISWLNNKLWNQPARGRLDRLLRGNAYKWRKGWKGIPTPEPLPSSQPFRNIPHHTRIVHEDW